jgi:hypothetical protein
MTTIGFDCGECSKGKREKDFCIFVLKQNAGGGI